MKKVISLLEYFIALNLIIIGLDKFFTFIPEACSLMIDASKGFLYIIGVFEILLGVLLFFKKSTRIILTLIVLLMIWGILLHLYTSTDDYGGAAFLCILALLPLILSKYFK